MRGIIDSAREATYRAVNNALVQRNRLIGYRIAEKELSGENRAEYWTEVIKKLSRYLTSEYGNTVRSISFPVFIKRFPKF